MSFVDTVHAAEELEDVLAVERLSSSDVAAETIVLERKQEYLAVPLDADALLLLKIQLGDSVLLQKLEHRAVISGCNELCPKPVQIQEVSLVGQA